MPDRPGQAGAVERERVLEALSTVRDPELDEPITTLGFVEGLEIGPGVVRARLRLPTFFCAPNFAFLMVADARAAVRKAVGDGVEIHVRLVDHSNSDEINDGVEQGGGFEGTFGDEAGGELEELRVLFWGKSFVMRQERLCRRLMAAGVRAQDLRALTLADLPEGEDARRYLARRAELGIDTSDTAPFLVDTAGRPLPPESTARHLRFARTVRVSIEGNAEFCRGLLETRYGLQGQEATTA
ncbi:MAG TPA: iron-sulfur cluster assembly protein [Actinomycetes bacterium]|nr:iron-sulfur cluster assembly protein [Actinomycetes bacterium]